MLCLCLSLHCSYLEALDTNPDIDRNETLGKFIESHVYSELFQKAYLVLLLFVVVIEISFILVVAFFVHSTRRPFYNDMHLCSTDSNLYFNLDLSLRRSIGLFCVLHSFIPPRPPSSAGFFSLIYCSSSTLCVFDYSQLFNVDHANTALELTFTHFTSLKPKGAFLSFL